MFMFILLVSLFVYLLIEERAQAGARVGTFARPADNGSAEGRPVRSRRGARRELVEVSLRTQQKKNKKIRIAKFLAVDQ